MRSGGRIVKMVSESDINRSMQAQLEGALRDKQTRCEAGMQSLRASSGGSRAAKQQ